MIALSRYPSARRVRRLHLLAGWLLIAAPLSIVAGGFALRLVGWGS